MWPFAKKKLSEPVSSYKPTRPAPPMPEIKPVKQSEDVISEPVLSIIETLKNGEWEVEVNPYSHRLVEFTHCWHRSELTLSIFQMFASEETYHMLMEDWMTEAENKAVAKICYCIHKDIKLDNLNKSHAEQRKSFMCLVPTNKE